MPKHLHQTFMVYIIKEPSDICFHHIIRFTILNYFYDFPYRLMTASVWSEPKTFIVKLRLINLFQYLCDCILHQLILITVYAKRPHFSFRFFWNIDSSCGIWTVTAILHSFHKLLKVFLKVLFVFLFCHFINSACLILIHSFMNCP